MKTLNCKNILWFCKNQRSAWAFFFFFFYFHKSKLDALSPHYFIARVMRRLHSVGLRKGQLLHNDRVFMSGFCFSQKLALNTLLPADAVSLHKCSFGTQN